MEVKVITDVVNEPVTLAEVKSFCQIDSDYSADDSKLNLFISAAREKLEKELNLSFAEKELQIEWGGGNINLPYGPVISIDSVHPYNDDQINTEYEQYGLDFPSIWVPSASDCYVIIPISASNVKAYKANYTAGYEDLPKLLKLSLLIQIDWDLKNEGNPTADDLSTIALQKALPYSKNLFIQ